MARKSRKPQKSAYEKITDRIIKMLEAGVVPWHRPWTANEAPQNPYTPTTYSGINHWLLRGYMEENEWDDPRFATYNQIKQAGGQVTAGSKGMHVLYYVPVFENPDAKAEDREVKYMRSIAHTVFNIQAQSTGITLNPMNADAITFNPIERADAIIAGYQGPSMNHDGMGKAYYKASTDSVHMPKRESFETIDAYYSTLFHELAHSTGHTSRLNRGVGQNRFGTPGYAREELIAEMSAAMLCGDAGIDPLFDNSAAYIASWLTVLRNDHALVIEAAREAEKAVKWITTPENRVKEAA